MPSGNGMSMTRGATLRPGAWRLTIPVLIAVALHSTACDVWAPPLPTNGEYDKGLVVFYPGSLNSKSEFVGFYPAFRNAGIASAIEIEQWGLFLEHFVDPAGAQVRNAENADAEAQRIKAYLDAHPGQPVTFLTYSGGAWFGTMVLERLAPTHQVDRAIFMSPAMDRTHDMTLALDGTREGIVVFWSYKDTFTEWVRDVFTLADSSKGDPAATYSFETQDPRLAQIPYDPAWEAWEVYGGHTDYVLQEAWITTYVAPWVIAPRAP